MITIKEYYLADSLDDAYDRLMSGKKNIILGGMMWLRMQKKSVAAAIDLSNLGLNIIEEKEDSIEIGAMATLSQIEKSEVIKQYFGNVFEEAFSHIVGTQFRNTATIGGSVFSKFGFSDPLTILMALDVKVVLYKMGTLSLEEFMQMPPCKDILVKLIIKKEKLSLFYECQRQSATDFPNLTVCISKNKDTYKIIVGARPARAMEAKKAGMAINNGKSIVETAKIAADELVFGSNMRAGKDYRKHIAKVFIRRGLEKLSV